MRALPPDGSYCLKVIATDKAGNVSETAVGVTVAARSGSGLVLSGYVDSLLNAHLSWSDSAGSTVAGYNIFRDNQKLNAEPVAGTAYLDPNLGEGIFIYRVQAVDMSGDAKASSNEVAIAVQIVRPVARTRFWDGDASCP
jgi:hypothetical protein